MSIVARSPPSNVTKQYDTIHDTLEKSGDDGFEDDATSFVLAGCEG